MVEQEAGAHVVSGKDRPNRNGSHRDEGRGQAPGESVNTVQLSPRQIRTVHELIITCGRYHFAEATGGEGTTSGEAASNDAEPVDKSTDPKSTNQTPSESTHKIRELVAGDINWSYLKRVITRQGVEPLVYHVISQISHDLLPAEVKAEIQSYRRGATIRNTFAVEELCRVVQAIEAQDVPVLSIKGPVLATVAYGDVNLRRYTDLDLLIASRHLPGADECLRGHGYTPFTKVQRLGSIRKAMYHVLSGQRPFRKGGGTFNVDLHTQLMPPGLSYPTPFGALYDRSKPVALTPRRPTSRGPTSHSRMSRDEGADNIVRRLSLEDMLQVLCFHGVKNQWAALKYVWDIAALITARPPHWPAVIERANAAQAGRIVGMGLRLAHRVGGAPVPDEVLQALSLPRPLRNLNDTLAVRFMEATHELTLSYWERIRFYLLLQNTLWNKTRYVLYSAARNVWSAWIK